MGDQDSFREYIAGLVQDDAEELAEEERVRAPGAERGVSARARPGWRDPDRRRRGTEPPAGGVRGERF